MFLCFYGNVLVTSFTVILRPLDYDTATRGNPGFSRRLPTAAARVRAQVGSSRICGGQGGTGAGFLWVLLFPLPILIPPTAQHSSSSITRGWYNRSISGRRTKWTVSPHTKKLTKKNSSKTTGNRRLQFKDMKFTKLFLGCRSNSVIFYMAHSPRRLN
jgi:hypothetical protein